jgi:hypothetical protein
MSTSIQEQDLIQKIKELEQRLNDIERQQRTIGGWTITPSSIQTGAYNTNSTRYLGDNGLSVSNTFRVDPSGNMTATSATVSGTINANAGTFTDTVNVNGTLQSSASGARWDINNTPRMRFFDATRERMRLTQDRIEFWDNSGNSAGNIKGATENGVPSVSVGGVFYAPSAFIGLGMTVGGALILETDIPASSSASGTQGAITWDNDYIYICVATNSWKRVALSSY